MLLQAIESQPVRAARAVVRLAQNPDDTAQVFTVIEAFAFGAGARLAARVRATPDGARLLATRPDIVPRLQDRDALRRLPDGSLGRAYLAFMERMGITADGLVKASVEGRAGGFPEPDAAYLHQRMRDTHDLWHTVTGYGGDVLGEAALLAFNVPQVHHPGVALIVLAALLKSGSREARATIRQGFERGRHAALLPAVAWEDWLDRPLGEVRAALRVDDPPSYTPVSVDGVSRRGLFASWGQA